MALREVFARFGFEFEGNKVKEADSSVNALAESVQGLVAVFASNAIVEGVGHLAEQLDQFDDLSAQTKISTDALQEWSYAARISGSSAEEFQSALTLLQKGLGNADAATSAQAKALTDLGIKYKDAAGNVRPLGEILPEVLDNFSNLPSEAKKAEVATALFGRAGVRMIPTLERGRAGFEAIKKEIQEFGGVVDQDAIANAGAFRDAMVGLDTSFMALKGTLAREIFPQLSNLVTGFAKMVGGLSQFIKGTTIAQNAGLALAGALAGPLFGALKPFLFKGLKFAAIYGAIDDVIAFVNGKGSVLADILDGAFGYGTAQAARDWVNDSIDQLGYFLTNADGALATFDSNSATTWQKVLAGFALMVNGSVDQFAAIKEGWESIYTDMSITFDQFILGVVQGWNKMIETIIGSGNVISEALHIDTSGLTGDIDKGKAYQDELQKRAYERESGTGRFAGGKQGERARERAKESTKGYNGLTAEEQALYDSTPEEQRYLLAAQPRETRREKVNAAADTRAANNRAAEAAAPVLAAAAQAGTTATLVDNRTVNLNFAKGTSASDRAQIEQAVRDVLKSDNRTALESLTQQASK